MTLEKTISLRIEREAEKLIQRYHAYHNSLEMEHQRNKKRILDAPKKIVKTPDYWGFDKKFNPFYVKKNCNKIAKVITNKIRRGEYKPNHPHTMQVPKSSGGFRDVTIYQIPDAAISSLYYEQLLAKNKHRFSSFSYAYRNDKNVHFAIQDISVDLCQYARTFVAEFDFSDFFGSISHNFLYDQFAKNGFFISQEEKNIIQSFLQIREKGIPQGSSISLFLANLVCWEMDKQLEKNGLQFARYADDTVVWSQEYSKICKAFEIIHEFSKRAGISINAKKSDGISLLTGHEIPAELANKKDHIDFLGYSVGVDNVSIKQKSVLKIKKQISYILYRNLIQPLKGKKLKSITIPSNNKDEDLLISIMKIRRYLYGNLSEVQLRNFLLGRRKALKFKGVMSYYPLLNDEKQLRELDGWLLSVIFRSLKVRANLLQTFGFNVHGKFPFNVSKYELLESCKNIIINKKRLMRVPSFFRIYLAIKMGLMNQGIERTMNPNDSYYE